MGVADLVPGVSGGTVAFVLGMYSRLIEALRSFNFRFLASIVCGMALAVWLLAPGIAFMLNDPQYRQLLFAVFFGLIVGSSWYCAKQIKKWDFIHFVALFLGIGLSCLLTFWGTIPGAYDVALEKDTMQFSAAFPENYDVERGVLTGVRSTEVGAMMARGYIPKTPVVYQSGTLKRVDIDQIVGSWQRLSWIDPWICLCGAFAISAMLLPGISGSYLLMVLGVYPLVIGSVAEIIQGLPRAEISMEPISVVMNLSIGIVLGALFFSRLISWLLQNYSSQTLALLLGFMVGALGAVWPFWSYRWVLHPLRLDKGVMLEPLSLTVPSLFTLSSLTVLFVSIVSCLAVLWLEKQARSRLL